MTNSPQKSAEANNNSLPLPSKLDRHSREILEARNSKLLIDLDSIEAVQLITRVCVLVNCSLPTNTEDAPIAQMLWEQILKHHRSHTVKSFLLAFEYNAVGKYEKRIEHYNSFGIQFVSDVLNEYEKVKRKAVLDSQKGLHQDHAAHLLDMGTVSDELRMNMYNDHLEQVKRGNFTSAELFGSVMYDWLVKSSLWDESKIKPQMVEGWQKAAKARVFDQYSIGQSKWDRLKEQKSNEYNRLRVYIINEQKRLCYLWWLQNQ